MNIRIAVTTTYIPEQKEWFIYREFVANNLDADPDGHIVDIKKHIITFFTRTWPSIFQMTTLGGTTKQDMVNMIGQFGEGAKMAALIALRMGGTVHIRTPEFSGEFRLLPEEGAPTPVLYLCIRRIKTTKPGCLITVNVPGVDWSQFQNRFLTDRSPRLIPHTSGEVGDVNIFNKGVFICKVKGASAYDWSFSDLTLNRDRAIPDTYTVMYAGMEIMNKALKASAYDLSYVMSGDATFDIDIIHHYGNYLSSSTFSKFRDAFRNQFGDKAAIASTNERVNDMARSQGYLPVNPPDRITDCLRTAGCPTADALFSDKIDWPESPTPHKDQALIISLLRKGLGLPADMPFPIQIKWHDGDSERALLHGNDLWLPVKGDTRSCLAAAIGLSAEICNSSSSATGLFQIVADMFASFLISSQ